MSRRGRGRKGGSVVGDPGPAPAAVNPIRSPVRATSGPWDLRQVLLWVAVAVAVSGVWRWSLSADGAPITGPGLESALRLMCGSLAFWLLGRAAIRAALHWCGAPNLRSAMHGLPVQLCAVAVGQLLAVSWLVLRSGFHEISMRWTGIAVPVTGVEVAALLLLALGSLGLEIRLAASRASAQDVPPWRSCAVQMAGFVILIGLICLAVGFREMPRISTLSSDPDVHALFARMVMRLGVIPWDQGILGEGSFGYPGGYAALNASWCAFSGISVIDAVTIQPVLQFLFGCVVIAAFSPWCIARSKGALTSAAGPQVLLVALLLMLVYWFWLPYGMQRDRYFSEGTPRLSATMLTALIVMCWLAPVSAPLSPRERALRVGLACASLTVVATFNPITAIAVALPTLGVFLDECRRMLARGSARNGAWVCAAAIVAVLLGSSAILMSDPYFGERAFGARAAGTDGAAAAPESVEAPPPAPDGSRTLLEMPDVSIGAMLSPARALSYSLAGVGVPTRVAAAWAIALLASAAVWASRSPARALSWLAMFPAMALTNYLALCVPVQAGGPLPTYLIQPYLIDAVNQLGAVIAFCALGAGFAFVIQPDRAWQRAVAVSLVAAMSWLAQSSAAASGQGFIMRPRVTRLDGNMGVPTASELDAIRFWNQYASELVAGRPPSTYSEAPKILVLGNPRDRGIEQWVFPVGGGRLLPLESPLPTAFFYGHGNRDWSYSNYLDRVCRTFDAEWLRARNIRYVFMPADPRACIAIPEGDRGSHFSTLYQSGSAAILKLND